MDRKSKILLLSLALLVMISVGYTLYKTAILKQFTVVDENSEVPEQ